MCKRLYSAINETNISKISTNQNHLVARSHDEHDFLLLGNSKDLHKNDKIIFTEGMMKVQTQALWCC